MIFRNVAALVSSYNNSTGVDPVFLLGTESGIQDESSYAITMTQNGGAAQSSGWSQFGTYSAEFNLDNGSDDYYDLGSPATCRMDFGTEDFTIEGFAKSTINSSIWYHSIIGNFNGSDLGSWSVFLSNSGNNRVIFTVDGTTSTAATSDLNNDAFHFAVCREGNNTRIYVNGTLEADRTQFSNTSVGGTGNVRLGGNQAGSNDAWRGYIDELRVTKGVALYSGPTMTVPTAPYPRP